MVLNWLAGVVGDLTRLSATGVAAGSNAGLFGYRSTCRSTRVRKNNWSLNRRHGQGRVTLWVRRRWIESLRVGQVRQSRERE